MTHQNTTTFSSISEALQEQLQESELVCEVHGENKMTAFGREPICMSCERERIKQAEVDRVNKALDEHERRKTQSWLCDNSILLDTTLLNSSFDNYSEEETEARLNKEKALEIARGYFKGNTHNAIFTGMPGTGKSHLAMSVLKVVNDNSVPFRKCLFISIDELMRRIKDSFNNPQSQYTEWRMIEMLTSADLLVIDDLGSETGAITSDKAATNFTVRILYSIMNGRMDKPTIITTNLNSKELSLMYDSKLVSRIFRGVKGNVITFKETTDKRINIEF